MTLRETGLLVAIVGDECCKKSFHSAAGEHVAPANYLYSYLLMKNMRLSNFHLLQYCDVIALLYDDIV